MSTTSLASIEASPLRDTKSQGKTGGADRGHVPVLIVGGGQAGLSTSYYLKQRNIEHVVIEKHAIAHAWRTDRWDSFCLVTPNWQCALPDFPYTGPDPDGFMVKDDIVAYVEAFARKVDPPLHQGVSVEKITSCDGAFLVRTTAGTWTADHVVLAISGYHVPSIPRLAERLPPTIQQIHSKDYRNPAQLPAGDVLVIGTGQSGCQIAEDLHLAGRRVHLCVGGAPRSPRFYRGKDAIKWLDEMGYYNTTVETHPLGTEVRRKANHYFSGRGGGREIDLRKFATEGMELYGRLESVDGTLIRLKPDLAANLASADEVYLRIRAMIDDYIAANKIDAPPAPAFVRLWDVAEERRALDLKAANINSVIWATGFRADFSLVDLPAFNGAGAPCHDRGVTPVPGLYVLGLGWLWTWGSGRFSGIAEDADYIVRDIASRLQARPQTRARRSG
jgi:putative flavoprotein involved in K+ transport